MQLRRALVTTVLTAALPTVLSTTLAGCGHQVARPAQTASPSASSGVLEPSPYPADLATAVRTRGFDLEPDPGTPRVGVAAAVASSTQFRPPGVATAIHLARVTTPGFGSLDFSSPDHGSKHLFDATAVWVVVYDGEEAGQPGTWVVFVDATSGEAQAMVGFGAGLQGGAPCPNNRCIFE